MTSKLLRIYLEIIAVVFFKVEDKNLFMRKCNYFFN